MSIIFLSKKTKKLFFPREKKTSHSLREKTFYFFCAKTGTPSRNGHAARITPPLLLMGMLAAACFFPGIVAKAEDLKPAEQIICPDIKAAKSGSMLDEYYFARAYDKGYCSIVRDKNMAQKWYLAAARQGHPLAQHHLAEIYFTGNGGIPDYPSAKQWYLLAATQGHGLSQLRLAFLYAENHFKGLTTDYKEAEHWFLKAAEQDAGDARFRLGNFYHNYKNPPEMEKAVFWLTKAAEGGHRVAMFDLARLLRKGEGTPKNPEQSLIWLTKAAKLDLLSAQMTLSEMYAEGKDVPKDPVQSLTWTLKIVSQPSAPSFWLNKAGDIFFEGWEGIPKSYPRALRLYERAAAKNDGHALARLGRIYKEGLGVMPDPQKARNYLNKAAALGNTEAKEILKSSSR